MVTEKILNKIHSMNGKQRKKNLQPKLDFRSQLKIILIKTCIYIYHVHQSNSIERFIEQAAALKYELYLIKLIVATWNGKWKSTWVLFARNEYESKRKMRHACSRFYREILTEWTTIIMATAKPPYIHSMFMLLVIQFFGLLLFLQQQHRWLLSRLFSIYVY